MTARITEQSMTAPTTTPTTYPWHPRKPKHRAGDDRDWRFSQSIVVEPADYWPTNRRD